MFNVCSQCGAYRVDKPIICLNGKDYALCPECEHAHEFRRLPLFVATGPSGAGKSTCQRLMTALTDRYVILETDILWNEQFDTPEDGFRTYRETWLRMAKNISQSGKPVILCGAAMPDQMELCDERRYFAAIHYLALVCEDADLIRRLRHRPGWRQSSGEAFMDNMLAYNRWLKANAVSLDPEIRLLNTTDVLPHETASGILQWVDQQRHG